MGVLGLRLRALLFLHNGRIDGLVYHVQRIRAWRTKD